MKRLSSIHNPELKRLRLLIQKARERKKQQRFVIEGEREILKAILGGYQLESIFIYEGSDSHFSILFNKHTFYCLL